MEKLLNLTRAIAPKIKNSYNTQDIYSILNKDTFLKQIRNRLSPTEIIYLTFLIMGYKRGMELLPIYEDIKNNLFSFSVIYVDEDRPTISCYNCGGDGTIECHECDGSGRQNCAYCNGDGQINGENCEDCDGDGRVNCDVCDGDGSSTCDECHGDGDIEDNYRRYISQYEYFSIDENLFRTLEIMYEFGELKDGDDFSDWTFQTYVTQGDSENFDEYDGGQYLFGEMVKNPKLPEYIAGPYIRDLSLKDYV